MVKTWMVERFVSTSRSPSDPTLPLLGCIWVDQQWMREVEGEVEEVIEDLGVEAVVGVIEKKGEVMEVEDEIDMKIEDEMIVMEVIDMVEIDMEVIDMVVEIDMEVQIAIVVVIGAMVVIGMVPLQIDMLRGGDHLHKTDTKRIDMEGLEDLGPPVRTIGTRGQGESSGAEAGAMRDPDIELRRYIGVVYPKFSLLSRVFSN